MEAVPEHPGPYCRLAEIAVARKQYGVAGKYARKWQSLSGNEIPEAMLVCQMLLRHELWLEGAAGHPGRGRNPDPDFCQELYDDLGTASRENCAAVSVKLDSLETVNPQWRNEWDNIRLSVYA